MWETVSTIAVCLLIAAGVFFAIRSLHRSRKAGRCCGCSGGACAGCKYRNVSVDAQQR